MKMFVKFVLIILISSNTFAVEYVGEARKFIQENIFQCPSTGLTFKTPSLEANTIQIRYQEMTPGISWEIIFAGDSGCYGVVNYTKIRAEYPKTDAVLERTAAKIKSNVLHDGAFIEWCGFLSDSKGKVFQCINRVPEAGQTVSIRNNWLDSMESVRLDMYDIRQYLVRDGYFLEFSIIVPQMLLSGTYDEDKLIDQWMDNLNDFVVGCNLIGKDDNYLSQVNEFKRPKTYFRFIFKDPTRD